MAAISSIHLFPDGPLGAAAEQFQNLKPTLRNQGSIPAERRSTP
jgi:hypothetical protein